MVDLWFPVLRIVVAVYAGLCLLLLFRQSRYVYYPDRDVSLTPAFFNLDYDDVVLQTQDGVAITGWYVPTAPPAPGERQFTVLFCHGNGGDIGDRVGAVRALHEMGFNVFIFDYRGYGHSRGKPTEKGTALDVQAAWNYLKGERGVAPHDIIVFGRSLGGAVAAWLAAQTRPGVLYIESTFTSAPAMAQRMFPILPARFLCTFDYNTLAHVKRLSCPVFIAHSRGDEVVPFKHSQILFKKAKQPKQLYELNGGHNEGGFESDPGCQEAFLAFLAGNVR